MSHSPTRSPAPLGLEGVRLGFIVGLSPESVQPSGLLVDFDGNLGGPLLARSLVALTSEALAQAIATRQGAALLFERGNPELPLVMGLVQPLPALPATPEATSPEPAAPEPAAIEGSLPLGEGPLTLRMDEQRVVLEAHTELVLTCGQASITLQPDGRVIIRGSDIISHAKGMNRMRGAAIQLN